MVHPNHPTLAHIHINFTCNTHSRSGARWQDLAMTIHWMLEFQPGGQEQMLWDLAELLHQQVHH